MFSKELAHRAPWALQIWTRGQFHLSDQTLLYLQHLFAEVRLTELKLDVRSTMLRTFLSSDMRKGLGIFLTPEDVVRTMVEVVEPKLSDVVLDPACGSGTFLLETVHFLSERQSRKSPLAVYGVEKNPRMLLLADLNLGHQPEIMFHRACADSLREIGKCEASPLGLLPNSVDVILTNPPFGVTVTRDTGVLDLFETSGRGLDQEQNKVPSEVLFIELCLRLLRPGGRLGIVLPRSVITNEGLAQQRYLLDQIGFLTDIIDLPPRDVRFYRNPDNDCSGFLPQASRDGAPEVCIGPRMLRNKCRLRHDGTVPRRGISYPDLAGSLAEDGLVAEPNVTAYSGIPSTETLQRATGFLFRRNGHRAGNALREFVEMVNTGRTPGRSAYTENGMFILKVGNLTGRGINWEPRDRNFVSQAEGSKRTQSRKLGLRKGDILLTSSAHAARYIAKKVDIIAHIPENYQAVTFVGEVVRVHPASGVDPFILLAALRHPRVREDLQASVRGQTAHLHPRDLLEVMVPCDLRDPNRNLVEVARLLRQEADFAFQLSMIALRASRLLESANTAPV